MTQGDGEGSGEGGEQGVPEGSRGRMGLGRVRRGLRGTGGKGIGAGEAEPGWGGPG